MGNVTDNNLTEDHANVVLLLVRFYGRKQIPHIKKEFGNIFIKESF
jgi:hypothetical protein